jgi:hypothetical protein
LAKYRAGDVYGRWTMLQKASRVNYWKCQCACGVEKEVFVGSLANGASTSCGCYSAEVAGERSTKHGLSKNGARSKMYAVYSAMLNRCYNKNQRSFQDYGARGITVCDRWRYGDGAKQGLVCFVTDMEPGYSPGLQIDRVDNDKGYSPDNCKWSTRIEQAHNKRGVHLVCGVPKTKYASLVGVPLSAAYRYAKKEKVTLVEAINFLKENVYAQVVTS